MLNKYAIREEFELINTFKMLAQAYEEISVIKMQQVRGSVLSTRDFLMDLNQVFSDVKANYHEELIEIIKKKKKKSLNPLNIFSKKHRTVAILISANTKLYGDIVNKVFKIFVEDVQKNPNFDIVILGKQGKEQFDNLHLGKRYSFFDIPDSGVSINQLTPILQYIIDYEKVNVYYGLFNNVVTQTASVSSIAGEEGLISASEKDQEPNIIRYIFEPSLEKIFNFFKDQVVIAAFKQTIHEAELARLASRIKAMEDALGNIEKSQTELKGEERKIKKILSNKKQLDAFSGIALWTR